MAKSDLGLSTLFFFLVVGALLFLACDGSGQRTGLNPNYKEPVVYGYLSKTEYADRTIEYSKDFEVFDYDGLRMVPIVLLNGRQVEAYSYSPTMYEYGDAYEIPAYQKYEVEVKHYWGSGFCHLVMPADFHLTAPPNNYILGMESTLVSTWRASGGAQWYWASIYVDYDYYDTTGYWDNYTFTLDTLVQDTSIAVPPDRIFPLFVGELLEGDALVTVWAGYGPAAEPGDLGNIRGTATGFVNAINEPREIYFYVGAPPLARRVPDGRTVLARFKARLRSRVP
ncbi:MAG: hypothetical protein NTX53_17950 [candidate division WOR-3 bacterium]|nr:hypothetical protein [candidate division WOR-3 bacterium]